MTSHLTGPHLLFQMYCDDMLPKGPHGKTVEDMQPIIDKYKNRGLDRFEWLYSTMRELMDHKNNRDIPPEGYTCSLTNTEHSAR